MGLVKWFKGIFIHNTEGGGQIFRVGTQDHVDIKVTPSLVCGIKSGIGGSETHAIDAYPDHMHGDNRLMVDGSYPGSGGRCTPFSYSVLIATGAVPASIQIATPTAGKKIYITSWLSVNNSAGGGNHVLRDGVADGGTIKAIASNPTANECKSHTFPTPLVFSQGIRFDAANQAANATMGWTLTGWEE